MVDFSLFISSILGSIADFLWSDSLKWVTAAVITLLLIKIVKELMHLF